jgi:hypothetical protein
LREHEQAFRDKGAALAAVGLGDRNYARMFREETGITFPLLIDEGRQAYRVAELKSANLLHLLRSENAVSRKRARAGGHHQHKRGKTRFSSAEALCLVREMWTDSRTSARPLETTLPLRRF